MFTKRETGFVIIIIILMALILSGIPYVTQANLFLLSIIYAAVIILISVFAKKITAYLLDVEINIRTVQWSRYGLFSRAHFKYPIPVGLLLPILLSFVSNGWIKCFTFLQFTAKALPSKVTKRYGRKRFSGVMDWDDAMIVFWSTLPLIILSIIMKIIGAAPALDLSRISLYYVLWNLIPFSGLDGTKLFFGSRPLFFFTWVFIALTSWIVLA